MEYIVRMRGAAVASTEVRGLARDFQKLAVAETEAGAAGKKSAAGLGRGSAALGFATKASKVGALALAATAFEAVKLSNTFDTEMLKVRTDAGATTGEMTRMKGAVLDLAKSGASLGANPQSLAMGLYHLESLGIRGSRALHALKLAAEGSALSGADLEETTSALGAAMFVGIKGAGGLDHIMALLNATVGTGNMRMGELVHSLGTGVLSTAKVAGLSIQDVTAALAVFSDAGQSASSAAAQFGTALHFLYSPTDKATKALAQIGLGRFDLATKMRGPGGMISALKELRDHLSGLSKIQQASILGDIVPGGRGKVLLTELTMLDRAEQKWKQQAKLATSENFKAAVALQKNNPATKLRTAWAALQAGLIEFGHKVGPPINAVLGTITMGAAKLLGLMTKYPAVPIVLFVGLLTIGFAALGVAVWGALGAMVAFVVANPIALAIVGLIALIVVLATHFDQVKRGAQIWAHRIGGAFSAMGNAAGDAVGWVHDRFMGMVHFFASIPGRIAHVAKGMFHGIADAFRAAINFIIKGWDALHFRVPGFHVGPVHFGGFNLGLPQIPMLADGGSVARAGAALVGEAGPELLELPEGAKVTPLDKGRRSWLDRDIVLKVDGRELARVTRRQMLQAQAAG